jgi:hypothetical protein
MLLGQEKQCSILFDNIYQSLTQSRYSYNNHYDHKNKKVLMNDNPKSKVIPQWKTNKM